MNTQKAFLAGRLANKYAQAYLNVFGSQLDMDQYHAIRKAAGILMRNKTLIALMHVSFADHLRVKREVARAIVSKFDLPASISVLCLSLIHIFR